MGKLYLILIILTLAIRPQLAVAVDDDPIQVDIRNLVKVASGTTGQCTIGTTQIYSTTVPVAHYVNWFYVTYREDDGKEKTMAADLDASRAIYSSTDQAAACADAKVRSDATLHWMRLRFNDIKQNNLTVKAAGACSAYFFVGTVKGQVTLGDKSKVDNVDLEIDQRAVPCPKNSY